MSNNTNKIRSRFQRDTKNPRPGRFQTEGDSQIIVLIHEYKYLTRALLELLTGRKGTSLKNRLRFLYDNRYLSKIQFSKSYIEKGTNPDIYVLDVKGREVYKQITGEVADKSPKRNLNKDPQLEHNLLINTVRAVIQAAVSSETGLKLLYWQRAGENTKDEVNIGLKRLTIAPDAFFVVQRSDGKAAPFFLEADRTTMDQKRFITKLAKYYAYYRQIRKELDMQKGSKSPTLSNRFGVRGFRVLTVVERDSPWQQSRNADRLQHLTEAAFKATAGKGWRGFWFVSKTAFDIKNPKSVLNAIWLVAHPKEKGKRYAITD